MNKLTFFITTLLTMVTITLSACGPSDVVEEIIITSAKNLNQHKVITDSDYKVGTVIDGKKEFEAAAQAYDSVVVKDKITTFKNGDTEDLLHRGDYLVSNSTRWDEFHCFQIQAKAERSTDPYEEMVINFQYIGEGDCDRFKGEVESEPEVTEGAEDEMNDEERADQADKVLESINNSKEADFKAEKQGDIAVIDSEDNQNSEDSTPLEQPEPVEVDDEFIVGNLELGMSEEEVIALFGEASSKGQDAMEGRPKWRYDIGATGDYHFEPEDPFWDEIDVDGIQNGNVSIQLFISWEGKRVFSYTYYLQAGDSLGEYRVFPDGTVKRTY